MARYNDLVVEINANIDPLKRSMAAAISVVDKLSKSVLESIDLTTEKGKQMLNQLASEAKRVKATLPATINSLTRSDLIGSGGQYTKEFSGTMLKSKKAEAKIDAKITQDAIRRAKQLQKVQEQAEKARQQAVKQTQKAIVASGKAVERSLTSMGRSISTIGTRLSTLGTQLSNVGQQLTTTTIAVSTLIGGAALRIGTSFEQNMNRVKAITGAVGEDFQALEDEAKRLGVTTPKTARDIAEGMSTLALSGMTAIEVLENIPGVVNLSIITMDDMATSAQNAADIMAQFGRQGLNLGQIMDIISKTATTSNQSVQQLIDAMKFAGPVAANLGVSVEETAAMLGTMANAGVRAGIAGRAARMIFLSLSAPSTGAAKAIEELGLSTFDAQGNFKSMSMILEEMNELMHGWGEEQRQSTLRTIFGTRALGPLTILLNSMSANTDQATDSFKTYADMLVDVNDVTKQTESVTEELVKDINSGFVQASNELKSALEGLLIELQELLVVGLEPLWRRTTEIVRAFATMEQGSSKILNFFFNLKENVGIASEALTGLTITFQNFEIEVGRTISNMAMKMVDLVNAWGELLGVGPIFEMSDDMTQGEFIDKILAVAALAPMLLLVGKAISMVGVGLTAVGGIIGVMGNAVGPLFELGSKLYPLFLQFANFIGPLFGIGGGASGTATAGAIGGGPIAIAILLITGLIKGLIEHFNNFKGRLMPVFGELFKALMPLAEVFMTIVDIIGDVLGPILLSVLIPAIRLLTMALKLVNPVLENLEGTLKIIGFVLKVITSLVVGFTDAIDWMLQKVENSKFFNFIKEAGRFITGGLLFGEKGAGSIDSDAGLFGSAGGNDWANTLTDTDALIDTAANETGTQNSIVTTNAGDIINNFTFNTETPIEEIEQTIYDANTRAATDEAYGGGG